MILATVENIIGENSDETRLLRGMAVEAQEYIQSFQWCPPIRCISLGYGVGNVVGIFKIDFQSKIAESDQQLWVIVGDVPSAYVVVEDHDSARDALERYCQLMDNWVTEVLISGDFSNVFPVQASRTMANAQALRRRLDLIRLEIIPQIPDGNEMQD